MYILHRAVIASAVGLYGRYHHIAFGGDAKGAYVALSYVILQGAVEINIIIICGCLPACAPFFKHLSTNRQSLAALLSRYVKSRISKKSSGNSSLSDPALNDSLPITEIKVETKAEANRIVQCIHVPGRGYVPIESIESRDQPLEFRTVCFAGN